MVREAATLYSTTFSVRHNRCTGSCLYLNYYLMRKRFEIFAIGRDRPAPKPLQIAARPGMAYPPCPLPSHSPFPSNPRPSTCSHVNLHLFLLLIPQTLSWTTNNSPSQLPRTLPTLRSPVSTTLWYEYSGLWDCAFEGG